jgi:hypothetical protein
MVSSPAATEKAGAMGREIESRQGICRVVAFRRKNCSLPELSEQSLTLDGGLSPSTDGEVDLNGGRLKKNESSEHRKQGLDRDCFLSAEVTSISARLSWPFKKIFNCALF